MGRLPQSPWLAFWGVLLVAASIYLMSYSGSGESYPRLVQRTIELGLLTWGAFSAAAAFGFVDERGAPTLKRRRPPVPSKAEEKFKADET